MVESAVIILLVLGCAYQNVAVPFVGEKPNVAYRNVNALVSRTFDKRRKTVMIPSDVHEMPMILLAYRTQIVDIFRLKTFVVISRITSRRKLIVYVFFQVFDLCHNGEPVARSFFMSKKKRDFTLEVCRTISTAWQDLNLEPRKQKP